MKRFRTAHIILILLSLLTILYCFRSRLYELNGSGWQEIITSDGKGYYAYLPAILIHGDLSFCQVIQTEKYISGLPYYRSEYLVPAGDRKVNKYFAGEALLMLPFFVTGMLFTSWVCLPMNGYSLFFQFMAAISTLVYLALGCLFLCKIFRNLGYYKSVVIWSLVWIVFGTNLIYYALWQPTMSHIYSFFAINGFCWYVYSFHCRASKVNACLTGLFLGITLLIRPTNALVLFLIPVIPGNYQMMKQVCQRLSANLSVLSAFLIPLLIIISIQPVLWYLQTGSWFLWPYRQEGFDFMHPRISDVLFSYRKGMFLWSPLLLISLLGLIPMFRKEPYRLLSAVIFLTLLIWLNASWWNWYYGDGFGHRVFIDFYILFAFFLVTLFSAMHRNISRIIMLAITLLLIAYNLFQTWQYTSKIIHPFNMDREKYWFVFLQYDSTFRSILGGNREDQYYGTRLDYPAATFKNDFERIQQGWQNYPRIKKKEAAWSGSWFSRMDSSELYSAGLEVQTDRISGKPRMYYVEVSLMLSDSLPEATRDTYFIITIDDFDFQNDYYYAFRVNDTPVNNPHGTWRQLFFSFNLPDILNPAAKVKMFLWNPGKKVFYLDDLTIRFFQVLPSRSTTA